ncbi:MAG TPA: peptidoglycan DD-metalloendopeptidase family protein [Caulobacteraceae bacterium]|nr:peptidoglycan DD-metalloendopeptidase family protein [Caulobacteraceae bacterium]
MRRASAPIAVLAAVLALVQAPAAVGAHRPLPRKAQKAAPHKPAPPRLTPEQARQQRQGEAMNARAARLKADIADLKRQLVQLGVAEAGGEAAASDKKARLAQLNAQEQTLTDSIAARQTAIAHLMGALELYRRNPPPAFLVHPGSAKDAVRAQILARAIAPELESQSHAIAAQIEDVRRLRRVAEAASDDLIQSESKLADQKARIEALIDQKTALEQQLDSGGAAAQAAARALADASAAPAALIARLPQIQGHSQPAGAAPAGFIAPVQGALVATYGQANGAGHAQGMTWRAAPGSPVLAPAAGTVEYAGPLKGYGVVLILQTGGAYHLVLAGLQAASETTGQSVAAGEPIGRMADDAAAPTDLYLEVRRDGEPVDPARWLGSPRR